MALGLRPSPPLLPPNRTSDWADSRVRVIVLVPEEADISETAWTETVAASPAFDFLKDAAEGIYTSTDGKPFDDQR
jgi:hypothetical protein